jgi:hypothetical protein
MIEKMGLLAAALLMTAAGAAQAAGHLRFWNTTSETLTEVQLAPVGTTKWGLNQCLNDDNKSVEADERLDLEGVTPGHYDVRVVDEKGRICVVKNVEVRGGGKYAFDIGDKDLTDCTKP